MKSNIKLLTTNENYFTDSDGKEKHDITESACDNCCYLFIQFYTVLCSLEFVGKGIPLTNGKKKKK